MIHSMCTYHISLVLNHPTLGSAKLIDIFQFVIRCTGACTFFLLSEDCDCSGSKRNPKYANIPKTIRSKGPHFQPLLSADFVSSRFKCRQDSRPLFTQLICTNDTDMSRRCSRFCRFLMMISQIFVLRCVMPKLWKLDTNGCHRTIDCSPSVWILQTRRTACLRIYERFTETLVSQWHLTPNNLVVWKRFIGPLMSFVHEGCILFHRLCPELPGVRMLSEPVYLSWRG